MLAIREWFYLAAIASSTIRMLVLFWITVRCCRFLRGHWWRICCGQSIRTVAFVVTCFGHSFGWTIHAAYLCLEIGLTLSNVSEWSKAPLFFCNAQAATGSIAVATHVALAVSQLLLNTSIVGQFSRKSTRNATVVSLLVVIPIASVLIGRFRYGKSPLDSKWNYVDMTESLPHDLAGQNVSVDLHLLLCDQGINFVRPSRLHLTSVPVLTEVALVMGLVVLAVVVRYLFLESTTSVSPLFLELEDNHSALDHHLPCSESSHPLEWLTNSLPLVVSFWVIVIHPLLYVVFTKLTQSSWLNVGVGTHLLLILCAIFVSTSGTEWTFKFERKIFF